MFMKVCMPIGYWIILGFNFTLKFIITKLKNYD
jgi:hypothetical protein